MKQAYVQPQQQAAQNSKPHGARGDTASLSFHACLYGVGVDCSEVLSTIAKPAFSTRLCAYTDRHCTGCNQTGALIPRGSSFLRFSVSLKAMLGASTSLRYCKGALSFNDQHQGLDRDVSISSHVLHEQIHQSQLV
eukprot:5546788-Amphidinium_carterae.1